MMLTHYIILLHQLTPSSPKFLPLVGCCIITLMIVGHGFSQITPETNCDTFEFVVPARTPTTTSHLIVTCA